MNRPVTTTETRHGGKPVSTRAHGVMDYIVGVALLLAPNLFGFVGLDADAVWVPRVVGIIIIVQSIFTRYELGLIKALSMRAHLMLDYVLGIFLALSPWILGFYTLDVPRLWVPHLVVGLLVVILAAMTEKEPRHLRVTEHRTAHA
jgi:hypothetical protein